MSISWEVEAESKRYRLGISDQLAGFEVLLIETLFMLFRVSGPARLSGMIILLDFGGGVERSVSDQQW